MFFAVGWPANLEGLELATAGVAAERGRIPVNDWLQTNLAHIFAAGDVNGHSMLVPSARHEGRLAAENAVLGTRRRVAHDIVPTGSFTDPEYASVGLTEAQARERYDCAVAVVRYDYLLRAVIDGHAEGFCKLIVERRHRYLLGAHVLGEYSAEVIQVAAVAMAANLRVEQLAELQLAFPTFTEASAWPPSNWSAIWVWPACPRRSATSSQRPRRAELTRSGSLPCSLSCSGLNELRNAGGLVQALQPAGRVGRLDELRRRDVPRH